jgi:hypothetical protein
VGKTTEQDGHHKEAEMFGKTHMIRRMTTGIAVTASVALFAVPVARGFDGRSPDTRDAGQAQLSPIVDGRSADAIDAGYQARLGSLGTLVDGRSPDTLDAAYQSQLSTIVDGRSPDAIDAGYQARLGLQGTVVDGRSPDTVDAGVLSRTQVVEITSSTGFNWSDFGIGVAVAVGALFILVGLGAGMRQARRARHRLGNA